jgi:hypothetical protein
VEHEVRVADDFVECAVPEQVRLMQCERSCMPRQPAEITYQSAERSRSALSEAQPLRTGRGSKQGSQYTLRCHCKSTIRASPVPQQARCREWHHGCAGASLVNDSIVNDSRWNKEHPARRCPVPSALLRGPASSDS